ncbi:ornithine acetyltransferase [candidate division BRC1 bacterium HGW-BRC1-1]|nr:MAG: ornithine acetyltransferase [candidate division BRC1 bacterium HGW-BRC1-1]
MKNINSKPFDTPLGFFWAAAEAGIKLANRLDLGLLNSETPCNAAAVFTQNLFCAAPVTFCREMLSAHGNNIRGVVVNSGCANAATGPDGLENARLMARMPQSTGCAMADSENFFVCSTGTIGVQLPMDRIRAGIAEASKKLAQTTEGFLDFATAIMTTDTVRKTAAASLEVEGTTVRLVACAKGSGMIHPDMATLLAYVATDAKAAPEVLDRAFRYAVDRSLNCMTVDGDTSTNDTAIILANGASGAEIAAGSEAERDFTAALTSVLQDLARQLARDGEGATKLVEILVTGAPDFLSARKVGRSIAGSNLVKTAIYGRDANWGRIVCSAGYAGVPFDVDRVRLTMGEILLFEAGGPVPFSEEDALKVLSEEKIVIHIDLGAGNEEATVWTCDLTEKYIEINGSYRT